MTHQLFLGEPSAVAEAVVGSSLLLDGDEGRHAAAVVRLRPGERYFVADGAGRRVLLRGRRTSTGHGCAARCSTSATSPSPGRGSSSSRPSRRATATSRRSRRRPSSASTRSSRGRRSAPSSSGAGDRAAKSLAKWVAVVARATKQSRRARMPSTSPVVGLAPLVARVAESALHARAPRGRHRAAGDGGPAGVGRRARRRRARGRHHRPRDRGAHRRGSPRGASRARRSCARRQPVPRPSRSSARAPAGPDGIRRSRWSSGLDAAVGVETASTRGGAARQRAVKGTLLRHRGAVVGAGLEDAQHVGACRQRLLRRERVRTPGGGTSGGGGEAAVDDLPVAQELPLDVRLEGAGDTRDGEGGAGLDDRATRRARRPRSERPGRAPPSGRWAGCRTSTPRDRARRRLLPSASSKWTGSEEPSAACTVHTSCSAASGVASRVPEERRTVMAASAAPSPTRR